LPRLCRIGGASRVCRRFLWRKIRTTVAVPVLATVRFGGNLAICANKKDRFLCLLCVLATLR
jgi:hypothetical protein